MLMCTKHWRMVPPRVKRKYLATDRAADKSQRWAERYLVYLGYCIASVAEAEQLSSEHLPDWWAFCAWRL